MRDKQGNSKDFSAEDLICDESFQRYCSGVSLSDQEYWEEWISKNSHKSAEVREAERMIGILSAKQGNRLVQLKQLSAGIRQFECLKDDMVAITRIEKAPVKKRGVFVYKYIGGIAATIFIGLMAYAAYTFNNGKNANFPSADNTAKYLASGNLDRKTIFLEDGSVVTLRKNSTLKFNDDFNTSQREVWLKGEAFFDIKHDEKHPFTVHTDNDDIIVLGTAFNVSAYPDSKTYETSLIRGSVKIISHNYPHKAIILKPNQKLISQPALQKALDANLLNERRVVVMSAEPNDKQEIKWVRSRLNIENESLSQIAGKLQGWYGINIVFEDERVKTYRYSGVFENENLIKSLEALQLSYPFDFRVEEDKIIISSK